jgi:hypothetical protein
MARPVLWREERRSAPLLGSGVRRTAARGLCLAAILSGGDVSARMAVRSYDFYCRCGCEREGGVPVRGGQGQGPFRAVGNAAGMPVGHMMGDTP